MLKKIGYTLCLLLVYLGCTAQSSRDLFYFLSADSLLGVKDGEDNIVIPAKHEPFWVDEEDFSNAITDRIILLLPHGSRPQKQPYSYGLAYDREGHIRYAPYLFDNGPDYIVEGLRRYVENGKMGFVDRDGNKVIPAQWDWASAFNCGIAMVCNHCQFDYTKDQEHPPLDLSKAKTMFIDQQGNEIIPLKRRHHAKDLILNGVYFSYPFHYSRQEKKLFKPLNDVNKRISKAYFVNWFSPLSPKERTLHYEIVERPSTHFPYHIIQAFYRLNSGEYQKADLQFCADTKGEIYYLPFDQDVDRKIPLLDWLINDEADARHYSKEHGDAPYRY
ncbi:WG repeat-containing protein [Olivibacter ginsenosidimutans]